MGCFLFYHTFICYAVVRSLEILPLWKTASTNSARILRIRNSRHLYHVEFAGYNQWPTPFVAQCPLSPRRLGDVDGPIISISIILLLLYNRTHLTRIRNRVEDNRIDFDIWVARVTVMSSAKVDIRGMHYLRNRDQFPLGRLAQFIYL